MENAIFIAEPTKDYTTFITLMIGLVLLLGFLFLVQNKKIEKLEGAYRQIVLLLGGLSALILFATTLFTGWNLYRIQPVELYETHIETFKGKLPYDEIKRVGIFNDKQQSLINPTMTVREDNILVIETKNGRSILFAEENYELMKLVKKIKEQMK